MMDGVPIRKLIVINFAERTTFKDFRNYFSTYGNVEDLRRKVIAQILNVRYLHGNQGRSNCAFVTFTNVADAVKAMQDGGRERLHNRDLRVMAAAFCLQPEGMERRLYNMGRVEQRINKASKRRIANEQYKYLQNDTESISIHMLNDDCLRHIFLFLLFIIRVCIEIGMYFVQRNTH